jgi:hypothetical protein
MFHNFNFQPARPPAPASFYPGGLVTNQQNEDYQMRHFLSAIASQADHHNVPNQTLLLAQIQAAHEESNGILRARLQQAQQQLHDTQFLPSISPQQHPIPMVVTPHLNRSRRTSTPAVVFEEQDEEPEEHAPVRPRRAPISRKTPVKKQRLSDDADFVTKSEFDLAVSRIHAKLKNRATKTSVAAFAPEKIKPMIEDLINNHTPTLVCATSVAIQEDVALGQCIQVRPFVISSR